MKLAGLALLLLAAPSASWAEEKLPFDLAVRCMLWGREIAAIETATGSRLTTLFDPKTLTVTFEQTPDVDMATATPEALIVRSKENFRTCVMFKDAPLGLPTLPVADTESWARRAAQFAAGRLGVVPAGDDPTPRGLACDDPGPCLEPGSEPWRDYCRAHWRTFREADDTVVRRGNSERVRCPA